MFAALNDRQVGVLRWVADGCPDGVMEGFSYKLTAIAFQGRRLVVVSKKGGTWRATLTGTGAYYLEHGAYQPAPPARGRPPVAGTGASRLRPELAERHPRRLPRPAGQPKALSPTEQLIADLLANGEVKVLGPDRAKYEARVAAAVRFGKVPEGKQLVTEGGGWSCECVVRLRDAPGWLSAALEPVPVPVALRRPHPVVTALQAAGRLVGLERSVTHRALLLVQALAAEAQRRGYTVKETRVTTDAHGYQHWETNDHFSVTIGGHVTGVQLRQEVDRARHLPMPAEEAKAASDRWYRVPKYDVAPSDRLSAHLSGGVEHRQSKWADGPTKRLEDCLAQVLQEIELRAEAAEQQRLDAIARAEEPRWQWGRAMEQARQGYAEAYRAGALLRQLDGWLRARQLRDYLDAMRAASGAIVDPDDAGAAKKWHRWAEEWAASVDPLAQPIADALGARAEARRIEAFPQRVEPVRAGPSRVVRKGAQRCLAAGAHGVTGSRGRWPPSPARPPACVRGTFCGERRSAVEAARRPAACAFRSSSGATGRLTGFFESRLGPSWELDLAIPPDRWLADCELAAQGPRGSEAERPRCTT